MAAPGYDLYYLNVMAGPGERAWLATDDPAHTWVRATWPGQPVDPRMAQPSRQSRRTTMRSDGGDSGGADGGDSGGRDGGGGDHGNHGDGGTQ